MLVPCSHLGHLARYTVLLVSRHRPAVVFRGVIFHLLPTNAVFISLKQGARSIEPKFTGISVQNSMDQFGPPGISNFE